MNDGPFNLCKMAVGSEGTLVGVTEARVNLVRLPTMTGLDVIHFDDREVAEEAARGVL